MTESADKPRRRPRYRGTHPRQFAHKYKEHDPERYADEAAKVMARGATPAGTHRPIMVHEILEALTPQPGEIAVDCTLGNGGHACELMAAIQPGGCLIALDRDPAEIAKAEARLRALNIASVDLVVWRSNFAAIEKVLAEVPIRGSSSILPLANWPASPLAKGGLRGVGVDMILADLGVSSMQVDDPARGFTFKDDGPLDMRMDQSKGRTAADLLDSLDVDELARLFEENADEPDAAAIATAILKAHEAQSLTSTLALANVIRAEIGRGRRTEKDAVETAVRRVFQALRIAVNDEFGALDALLRGLPRCLKPGGRVAILSFHSGEDRRVKQAFKHGLTEGFYASISEDVIRASTEEQRSNPRSSAAKLRFAKRCR